MNYILNNKLKFEKNRYNKPVIAPTPIILSKTLKNPSLPLPIKIDIPIHSYAPNDSRVDFKLNNHSSHLIQIIKQIQSEPKPHIRVQSHASVQLVESQSHTSLINENTDISEPKDIEPYYKNELIINIYGISQ